MNHRLTLKNISTTTTKYLNELLKFTLPGLYYLEPSIFCSFKNSIKFSLKRLIKRIINQINDYSVTALKSATSGSRLSPSNLSLTFNL